jgi:DnaJ like chaperone protein
MVVIPVIAVPFTIFQIWLTFIFRSDKKIRNRRNATSTDSTAQSKIEQPAERLFLYFVSALSAKIAKADGHIDTREIAAMEQSFRRLDLSEQQCKFCIETFHCSIISTESISSTAHLLKVSSFSDELKAILYGILWDVACAGGILTQDEKIALKTVSEILELYSYERYYRQRVKQKEQKQTGQHTKDNGRMSLVDAYEILGCCNSDTDAAIKAAYREKAKRNHPDLLKSQGLPEEMMDKATKRMGEINAAWDIIKRSRNL